MKMHSSYLSGACALILGVTSFQAAAPRAFDRVLLLESTSETSASVSIGDVDGNGTPDVVLAKGRHWPLNDVILLNDGSGRFTTSLLADAPDRTYSAALADLDGDGDLDIVASNDKPDRKLVYRNDGRGRFTVSGTFGDPEWNTRYVTVADLNGDRRPDLIVANRSSNPADPRPSYVCLNDGAGAFPTCRALPTRSATIIVAADLDGDGTTDLFVPHRDGGQNLVFWNDGSGQFRDPPAPVGPGASQIRAAAAGDINGDGVTDLVVGDERLGLFVYAGAGARKFDAPVAFGAVPGAPSGAPYAVAIADLNRDSKPDIVVGRQEAVGSVYFITGGGRIPTVVHVPWGDGKGSVYGVAIADLNGDGWPDIAAARSEAPNGVWFSTEGARAQANTDWAQLSRYRAANETLTAPRAGQDRVVLFGDSITEGWFARYAPMFAGRPWVGRGISGQTTPQMLVRFRQDVIALRPKVVVILAGTNDIAGNTGPSTLEMIEDNLASMSELAKANGIRVVLASVLPAADYPWKRGLEPAPKIVALNDWIRQYAAANGHVYLDYHTPLKNAQGGIDPELARDGVHPTEAGYKMMLPLLEAAIAKAKR